MSVLVALRARRRGSHGDELLDQPTRGGQTAAGRQQREQSRFQLGGACAFELDRSPMSTCARGEPITITYFDSSRGVVPYKYVHTCTIRGAALAIGPRFFVSVTFEIRGATLEIGARLLNMKRLHSK